MNLLSLWRRMEPRPLGKWLFSRAVCAKAPYFATIRPRFEVLEPGRAVVSMKKRRAVENHIGTVHAIACCNLAEIAAGTMMEASLPKSMRWLPRGMQVEYRKKAETDLSAHAATADYAEGPARDVEAVVEVRNAADEVVVMARIMMYVSPRKAN